MNSAQTLSSALLQRTPNITDDDVCRTFTPDIHRGVPKFLESVTDRSLEDPAFHHGDFQEVLYPIISEEITLLHLFEHHSGDSCLLDPLINLIDVFAAPPYLRQSHPRVQTEDGDDQFVFPVRDIDRRQEGTPCTVDTEVSFKGVFNTYTASVLSGINWDHLAVAGGSVLTCLSPEGLSHPSLKGDIYSDVDLYIYGLTRLEAYNKIRDLVHFLTASMGPDTICMLRKHTITVIGGFPYRPIQIHLRLYQSISHITLYFDIDCTCFVYNGQKIFASPRGITALVTQQNILDISKWSPRYEFRLAKYGKLGYEVYIGFKSPESKKINPKLFDPNLRTFSEGLGRLYILQAIVTGAVQYHHLRDPEHVFLWEKNTNNRATLDALGSRHYINTEDLRIPYGTKWTVQEIRGIITKMNHAWDGYLPSDWAKGNAPRSAHSHFIFGGTVEQCLNYQYADCLLPELGLGACICHGPLFLQHNLQEPSRSVIGLFKDYISGEEAWFATAYV